MYAMLSKKSEFLLDEKYLILVKIIVICVSDSLLDLGSNQGRTD